ncbi:hypothetical protein DF035_38535 [Burkholderia contaminans]|nr:hypothetical protein DF035_38535 [Burkholderia contaminans]
MGQLFKEAREPLSETGVATPVFRVACGHQRRTETSLAIFWNQHLSTAGQQSAIRSQEIIAKRARAKARFAVMRAIYTDRYRESDNFLAKHAATISFPTGDLPIRRGLDTHNSTETCILVV